MEFEFKNPCILPGLNRCWFKGDNSKTLFYKKKVCKTSQVDQIVFIHFYKMETTEYLMLADSLFYQYLWLGGGGGGGTVGCKNLSCLIAMVNTQVTL